MDFKWDRFAKGRRLNLKPFKAIVGRGPLFEFLHSSKREKEINEMEMKCLRISNGEKKFGKNEGAGGSSSLYSALASQ